jgi:3',5'-cyclic AMP phosphodiesterase CpdA
VIITAGDISSCSNGYDEATARLVDALPGTVLVLGDNVYERGTESEFARCYDPTWGRHRARTFPAVGNHEYGSSGAAPYFRYFGAIAGNPRQGWYSFDLGAWHLIALNSNCEQVGGCNAGSAQERWLRADLAAHPARCTLAFWHHPRFSSGSHGAPLTMNAVWRALYEAGADLVFTGHDHDYERFAPATAEGRVDLARGLREFVVGTGGAGLRSFSTALAHSEVRNNNSHGVLRVVLRPDRYEWEFFPVAGRTFTDRGSAPCH